MNLPNVKVSVWPCKNKGKIVATAKVMIGNAIAIYPLRLIQGRRRMFLGMPQMLDRAGDYRDVFFPINGEAREELTKMVIHTYNSAKNNFWDFPSQEEFKPEITVRLFSDPTHNMIGYADILLNKAFRIVNVRIFQGENGRRQIIFPERGYREDGEIIVKPIFEFRGDWEKELKKIICTEFDHVYEEMKEERIQVMLGKKDGDLSYDEMMEIRLCREAERRKEVLPEEEECEELIIQ